MEIDSKDLETMKDFVLSKPIFSVFSNTCYYCTVFIKTIQDLNKSQYVFLFEESTNPDIFKKLREMIKKVYGHRTVPAIFIKGRFIGGNDKFQNLLDRIESLISLKSLDRSLVLTQNGALISK